MRLPFPRQMMSTLVKTSDSMTSRGVRSPVNDGAVLLSHYFCSMNKSIVIAILFGAGLLLTSIDASAQIKLTTLADSLGYLTGRQFGQTVVKQGMPINRTILIAG